MEARKPKADFLTTTVYDGSVIATDRIPGESEQSHARRHRDWVLLWLRRHKAYRLRHLSKG